MGFLQQHHKVSLQNKPYQRKNEMQLGVKRTITVLAKLPSYHRRPGNEGVWRFGGEPSSWLWKLLSLSICFRGTESAIRDEGKESHNADPKGFYRLDTDSGDIQTFE